ncbi:MAG: hypothetical protein ACJ72W_15470 [Actinoallomurus sp.]
MRQPYERQDREDVEGGTTETSLASAEEDTVVTGQTDAGDDVCPGSGGGTARPEDLSPDDFE